MINSKVVVPISPNLLYDKKASALNALNPDIYSYLIATFSFWKSVRLATTQNIVLSGLLVIDGKQTVSGDRVLVKDQTDFTTEGIYIASDSLWTRSQDCLVGTIASGMVVYVADGDNYQKNYFICTSPPTSYVGVSDLQFYNTSSTSFFPVDPGLIEVGAVFYNIDGIIGVQLESGYKYTEDVSEQRLILSKTGYTNRIKGAGNISIISGDNATGKGGNFTITGDGIGATVNNVTRITSTGNVTMSATGALELNDLINNYVSFTSGGTFSFGSNFKVDGNEVGTVNLSLSTSSDALPIALGNNRQGFINLTRSIGANGSITVDITTNNYSSTLMVNVQSYAGSGKPVVMSLTKTLPNQIGIVIKNMSGSAITAESIQLVYIFL